MPRRSPSSKPDSGRPAQSGSDSRLALDLNEQTRATRHQQRVHRAQLGLRAGCWVLAVMALVSASRSALRQMFFDNPDYQVKTIRITSTGSLQPGEITEAIDIRQGDSLLRVNLQTVRSAVEALPRVESASVTRTLPSKLAIRIIERNPFARLIDPLDEGNRVRIVDRNGIILPQRSAGPRPDRLPAIQLPGIEIAGAGRPATHERLQAALELLELHALRQQTFATPVSIDGSKGYTLHCLYPNGMEVLFRPHDLALQFYRLERIARTAARDRRSIALVNLLAEKNLPVVYRPDPAAESASLAGFPR